MMASCNQYYSAKLHEFFGWGRRKDLPQIQPAYQELKKSDHISDAGGRSAQSHGTERWGTRYGSETVARLEDQTPQPRAMSPPRPWESFLGEAGDGDLETWEAKLQETIRFVFRHEREGLLTIGTFALDHLAGVTNLDGGQNKPPTTDHNSLSSMQLAILEVPSSDDEIDLQNSILRSSIPAPCRRNSESYPIFGDHDAPISCRVLSFESTKPTKPVDTGDYHLACTNDSANAKTDHAVAGIKEVVLSTTDSEVFEESDSEDFYSPGACNLFASRSRRTQKSAKEKQKKPPEKRKGDGGERELKRTGSCNKGSLGAQLGRLWRSGCARSHGSTKVTPEKKLASDHMSDSQAQGPPCIANVEDVAAGVPKPPQASEVGKQRNGPRKQRGHSFGKGWPCAPHGKWIRTDSEFVVLEM